MKIFQVSTLAIPDIKVIRFGRFNDDRGYFTESYRESDFKKVIPDLQIKQVNESFSKKGVIRGLHFQWNPYMAKLVRTVQGHMVDLFLDIRKNSPSFGKIAGYDMPITSNQDFSEWIWIPVGFAHGNYFLEDTTIEYFCTGEYSPGCEAGINPLDPLIDWSSCDPTLKKQFDMLKTTDLIISDKDKKGFTLTEWEKDKRAENFIYIKS